MYVDTTQEAFSFNYILHLQWTDKRLTWPTERQRLEITTVESNLIWLPKLRSWFAKDTEFAFEGIGREVKLFNNGTVYWLLASDTKGKCRINTKYFPFDKHRCMLAYSPEHAPNVVIGALFNQAILSSYSQPNADWKMTSHTMKVLPRPSLVVDTIYFIDEETRKFIGPQTGIVWEFEFSRNPRMMVNSWLLPFLVMMLSSNCVFLITLSGKTI